MNHLRTLSLRTLALVGIIGIVAVLVAWNRDELPKAAAYHSQAEIDAFRGGGQGLASGANNFFRASGDCYGCHGPDNIGPVFANRDGNGNDVNPIDAWRSSMMGNSARDPFWRAKVSHEVSVNPGNQAALEDKCTSCHAPMGRYDKHLMGAGPFSIAELVQDPIALDGVSCLACHMQKPDSLGLLFSGNLKFETTGILYGPHGGPGDAPLFGSPMLGFVGYEPLYGEHLSNAGTCAGCHTLITETADLEGNPTGDHFVEQATYHEWLNSSFNTDTDPENGLSCQACHMPRIDDAVVVSALYDFLTPRTPFGKHHLVGANVFMLNLLKHNNTALELTANQVHFDSTIARTQRMLQQQSLLLETTVMDRTPETAFIDVKLTNLAGHKFPSGYPARRAFIELHVQDDAGNTVFRSGNWDSSYEVAGHDADWEPHHDVITQQDQAQIYEMVMGDVNGNKTTVLERAKFPLKDNRLTPLGFSTSHISYDTTLIAGVPGSDIDFNRYSNGTEGSGTDITHYHVPMGGYTGAITITARVWYQSAPPRWMEEMFEFNTPAISTFRDMYEAEDGSPTLVKESVLVDTSLEIDNLAEAGIRIFPNPVRDGILRIDGIGAKVKEVSVLDMRGSRVAVLRPNGERSWTVGLPHSPGTYLVVIEVGGKRFVERVVRP
ncbi:MAG TPA: T9SS type A sorting domain-containing protein [Flavobacteriales bacterium]|nr:T9SS type A sorting domain-containing protein [Flavobacteriales bacterium]